jgi:glyoxylase-like metal-dependent hydrolase (beta-lactamase superfamily II)
MIPVRELFPNLFQLEIPLPDSPLKGLNSYIVKAPDRNLIVDTGFNREECYKAMIEGLTHLGVDLHRTDFFITHLHADHLGLIDRLLKPGRTFYLGLTESYSLQSWEWEPLVLHAILNGFPEDQARLSMTRHPGFRFGPKQLPEITSLKDGDPLSIGDFQFQCVETPGHTAGHTCLYEASKKIFLSGDQLLADITPNIQCWSNLENPLGNYIKSLERVSELSVDSVLPGHRRLIQDHRRRIGELKLHHEQRASEILTLLKAGPMNAFQIAAEMTWDIACDSWDEFPMAQKWFALGETIAHLRYLEELGRVQCLEDGGTALWSISKNGCTL